MDVLKKTLRILEKLDNNLSNNFVSKKKPMYITRRVEKNSFKIKKNISHNI